MGASRNCLCTSINNEVVHGIPKRNRLLKDGDLVSVDVGVFHKGYYADAAATFCVGSADERRSRLIDSCRRALEAGISQAQVNNRIGDIGAAVQQVVETDRYTVVRDLVGHGIGQNLHEDPQVPNYGRPRSGYPLRKGWCWPLSRW